LNLGPVSLPESEVAKHVIDLPLFRSMLPMARRLMEVEGDDLPAMTRRFAEANADSEEGRRIFAEAEENGRLLSLQKVGIDLCILRASMVQTLAVRAAQSAPKH
jgi:hypothetical protein